MSFLNLMEDIVKGVVDEVLKNDRDVAQIKVNRDDIVAYVLNRIPPQYVTSERGILHGKLQARYEPQQKTDILFCVYEAIDVIRSRRDTAASSAKTRKDDVLQRRVSHIVGEVLEETTLSMIPDVEVSLLLKGKPVAMVDDTWKNPYVTNRATRGYYHFWPDYLESEMKGQSSVQFTLEFKHPRFESKKVDVDIDILDKPDMSQTCVVSIVLLKAKDGVDLDFLYVEEKS